MKKVLLALLVLAALVGGASATFIVSDYGTSNFSLGGFNNTNLTGFNSVNASVPNGGMFFSRVFYNQTAFNVKGLSFSAYEGNNPLTTSPLSLTSLGFQLRSKVATFNFSNLSAYFSLGDSFINENQTNKSIDLSGNNNTLAYIGAPAGVNVGCAIGGNCVNFNGGTNYGRTSQLGTASLNFSAITVCAWVNPNTQTAGGAIATQPVATTWAGEPFFSTRLEQDGSTPSKVDWGVTLGGSRNQIVSSANLNTNVWTFVCGIYTGSAGMPNGGYQSIFINGAVDKNQSANGSMTQTPLGFHFGRDTDATNGEEFNGKLDEVYIWSRALGASEISSLYNSGNPSGVGGQVSNWTSLTSSITTNATVSPTVTGNLVQYVANFTTTATLTPYLNAVFLSDVVFANTAWSNNRTNTTAAGQVASFNVDWTSAFGLTNFTFQYDGGNGTLQNLTIGQNMTGTSNTSTFVTQLNATLNSTIRWQVFGVDSQNVMNATPLFTFQTSPLPPQWYNASNSSAVTGTNTTFTVYWNDTFGLVNYTVQFDGGNGTLYNGTTQNFTGLQNVSVSTLSLPTSAGSTIRWQVFASNINGAMNATSLFTFNTIAPPRWSLLSSNTTTAGQPIVFLANWTAVQGTLNYYIFQYDSGNGTLQNVSNQSFTGTFNTSNFTTNLPLSAASNIRWQFFSVDSNGLMNATTLQSFQLQASTIFTGLFDEVSLQPLNMSVNESNLAVTQIYQANSYYLNTSSSALFQGTMFLQFGSGNSSATGFYDTRRRYYFMTPSLGVNDKVFLLNATNPNTVSFPIKVIDTTGNGIGNANITQLKSIGGVTYTIDTEFTPSGSGSTGIANLWCNVGDSYPISVSSGSLSFTGTIFCLANTGATITLSSQGSTIANLTTSGNNATVVMVWPPSFRLTDQLTNITGIFNNSQGAFLWWGMNITMNATVDNATLTVFTGPLSIYYVNVTGQSPWGGQVGFPLNTTLYQGNYSVEVFWDVQGYPEQNYTFFFYPANYQVIGNASNINLYSGLVLMSNNLDPLTKIVIASVVSAIGAGVVTGVTGLGGGIVVMIFMGFFALVNFIPAGLYVLFLILGIVLFVMRVRG